MSSAVLVLEEVAFAETGGQHQDARTRTEQARLPLRRVPAREFARSSVVALPEISKEQLEKAERAKQERGVELERQRKREEDRNRAREAAKLREATSSTIVRPRASWD